MHEFPSKGVCVCVCVSRPDVPFSHSREFSYRLLLAVTLVRHSLVAMARVSTQQQQQQREHDMSVHRLPTLQHVKHVTAYL
jgi:hypothetical protein